MNVSTQELGSDHTYQCQKFITKIKEDLNYTGNNNSDISMSKLHNKNKISSKLNRKQELGH